MKTANLSKIDKKLKDMYQNQTTVAPAAPAEPYVDRSELLFQQMNFIASYNKSLLNL